MFGEDGGGADAGGGGSLLDRALEASGVKGEKLSKLSAALDAWKGGDDAALEECAGGYEDEPKTEETEDDGARPTLSDTLDKHMFGGKGKAPPFGGGGDDKGKAPPFGKG